MRISRLVPVFVPWMFGALSLWASLGPVRAGEDVFAAMRVRRAVPPVLAPDVVLPAVNGSSLRLADFQGKVVILGFFVTTCPSCRREAPARAALYREFQTQGLAVVGVNLQEEPEAVEAFAKALRIPFPLLLDREDRVQKLFGVRGHPSTVLIDRRGRIVGRILGERDWGSEAARGLVRSLLESGE